MGRLGGGVEREPLGVRLDRGDDRARLDCGADQAVVDDIDRDHVRGRAQRRPHRGLIAARPAEATLPGAHSCSCGAPGAMRRARVGHGGQRLVVHHDALGGVRRRARVSAITAATGSPT